MHARSFALLLALTATPLSAQEALRLDLNGSAPAAAATNTTPEAVESAPVAEAPVAQAAEPVARPVERPVAIGVAQNTTAQGGANDKDHIIACSIIYQRIADMYRERGDAQKADTFLSTAYAYSQASDILYTKEMGAESAYDAISQRMSAVSEALNREAQGYQNGDLGVVNGWLGWCDDRGDFVQATMDAFNAEQQAQAGQAAPAQ